MKHKSFTQGITFFVRPCMYDELKRVSDDLGIALSDLLRQMIDEYLTKHPDLKAQDQAMTPKNNTEENEVKEI